MKLEPTLDRVAIIREEKEKVTEGGIVLPENAKEESNYGEVVAVGPGGWNQDGSRREMSVKVGDVVFFTDFHVTQTKSKVVIVDDEDILAIVRDEMPHRHKWVDDKIVINMGRQMMLQECGCGKLRTIDKG